MVNADGLNPDFSRDIYIAVGSEMAGNVRNVLVKDCKFEDVYSIATIKAPRGRGAIIENIHYENCTLRNYSLEHSECQWFRGAYNITGLVMDNVTVHSLLDQNYIFQNTENQRE